VAIASAATAAVTSVVAVLQVWHRSSGESTVVGIERLLVGCLSAVLVCQLPFLGWIHRHSRGHWPAVLAGAGELPLAAVAPQSNLQGHDPSYFAALALRRTPSGSSGSLAPAVTGSRHGTLRCHLGVPLPFTWLVFIPLSSFGGGLLAAAYIASIARLARTAHLDRT
jgi:hypothetical protein